MRAWLLGVLLAAANALCFAAESARTEDSGPHAADRALAKQLSTELKGALAEALRASPERAVEVCKSLAPQISRRIGADHDVTIGRTSLRVRNPANAPSAWQRKVLEEFQRRQEAGEPASAMEYGEVIQAGGYSEQRYMKAIVTEPLCVTCHGVRLSPSVAQAIDQNYPNDAATGFNVGDVRGAVYVVRRLEKPVKH